MVYGVRVWPLLMAVPSSRVDQSERCLAVAAAGTSKEWQNRETAVLMNDLAMVEVVKFSKVWCKSKLFNSVQPADGSSIFNIFLRISPINSCLFAFISSRKHHGTIFSRSWRTFFLPHERTYGQKADVFGKSLV